MQVYALPWYNATRLCTCHCQWLSFANLWSMYRTTHATRHVPSAVQSHDVSYCSFVPQSQPEPARGPQQTCQPQQAAPLLTPLSSLGIWITPCIRAHPTQLAIVHCNLARLKCSGAANSSGGTGWPPTPCYCRLTDDQPATGSFNSALK